MPEADEQHWPTETDEKLDELGDALLKIKQLWSTGETHKIPAPLERARSLASELEDLDVESDSSNGNGDQEAPSAGFIARDLYPREELESRVRDHAEEIFAPLPHHYEIDDIEIKRIAFTDGWVRYQVTHPKMGVLGPV